MLLCMAVPPSPQPPPPRHTKGEHRIVVRRCRIGGSLAFGLVRVAAHVRVSTLHACMVVTGASNVSFRSPSRAWNSVELLHVATSKHTWRTAGIHLHFRTNCCYHNEYFCASTLKCVQYPLALIYYTCKQK